MKVIAKDMKTISYQLKLLNILFWNPLKAFKNIN